MVIGMKSNERAVGMPTKIKIGTQVFTVVERHRFDDATLSDDNFAYVIDEGNIIVIDKSIHISKKRVTLFHEVMHAARMVWDNPIRPKMEEFDEWEHYFIGIWENSLLLVLKENPQLVKWLMQKD